MLKILYGSSIWSLKDKVSLIFGEQTISRKSKGTCLAHLWLLEVFFQSRFFIDSQTAMQAQPGCVRVATSRCQNWQVGSDTLQV